MLCDMLFNSHSGCPPPVFIREDLLCLAPTNAVNISRKHVNINRVDINGDKDGELSVCLKGPAVTFTNYRGQKCMEFMNHGGSQKAKNGQSINPVQPVADQLNKKDPCVNDRKTNITLHQACEDGDLCMVKFILSHNLTDINLRGKLGRTPAMAAAVKGKVAVFDFLVRKGCHLSTADEHNDTLLHVACEGGNVEIVRNILSSHECDKEGQGLYGWTPLMKTVYFGHVDVFELLVSEGCNPEKIDSHNNTILHVASISGHLNMVKCIQSHSVIDMNTEGQFGRTPVMVAATFGHQDVVAFLLSKGCNPSLPDVKGNNILHLACIGCHDAVVRYVVSQSELNIDSRGQYGRTPVMAAAAEGSKNIVEFLVSKGCDIAAVDNAGNNALHIACSCGQVVVVEHIISQGLLDIESKGQYGRTSVMAAVYSGNKDLVSFLVSKGCNISAVDNDGNTLVHVICMSGQVDLTKYIILDLKVDVDIKGSHGWTPVMSAAYFGHVEVVNFLVKNGCKTRMFNNKGCNVLHVASMGGHVNVVEAILAQCKLGIDTRDRYQRTPVLIAAFTGHKSIVTFLISRGCNLSAVDSSRNNILHLACHGGHEDIVRYLISIRYVRGKALDKNKYGLTPGIVAKSCGYVNIVSLFHNLA